MNETGDVWQLNVGDIIAITQDGGPERVYEVTRRESPGSMGRSWAAGPSITARLSGGAGYSVTFDNHVTKTWRKLTSGELGKLIDEQLALFESRKKGA